MKKIFVFLSLAVIMGAHDLKKEIEGALNKFATKLVTEEIKYCPFENDEIVGDIITDENREKCLLFLNKALKVSNFKFEILDIKENRNLANITFIVEGVNVEDYVEELISDYDVVFDNLPVSFLEEHRSFLVNSYLGEILDRGTEALEQGYWKVKRKKGKATIKINRNSFELVDMVLSE